VSKGNTSKNLSIAKKNKSDEFYTQLPDIERELKHYKKYFKNKIVYCNCDDPRISNFFNYFALNFEQLQLKKLITTCYKNQNWNLFSQNTSEQAVYLEYEGDKNKNKVPDPEEIGIYPLKGDGDFRSQECIDLLKQADIVVTNPPFSLFRDYVAQLIEFEKKFIIIGSFNAINYKEIFKLIQDKKIWLGNGFQGGNAYFQPKDKEKFGEGVYDEITGLVKFRNVTWYTNLKINKRQEDLILYKKYNKNDYPFYDNYNAINVDKVKEIPMDYKGIMGVPITFLDSHNPDQFEILGLSQKVGYGLESTKFYDEYYEIRQDGTKTGSSGKKTNGNPVMKGKSKSGNYYSNGKEEVHSLYGRIFIQNKRL